MPRTLLKKIQLSLLALGLLGGGVIACGDDPAPSGNQQGNNGDGDDGDGDEDDEGDGDEGDGDEDEGDGDSAAQCESGDTKKCDCDDGETEGKLSCTPLGTWGTVCGGCPCEEGDVEICQCSGGKTGEKTCGGDGEFGTCECSDAPASTSCPEGTECGAIGEGVLPVMFNACVESGGPGVPPGCETKADCTSAGFGSTINCAALPAQIAQLAPLLQLAGITLPEKVCMQTCTPGSGTGGDAGT